MQYLLLIYGPESHWATLSEAESGALVGEYLAFSDSIRAQGIMQGGAPLKPVATAKTVRVREGRMTVSDGPVRRDPRAARRLLPGRLRDGAGGARRGRPHPERAVRLDRGAPADAVAARRAREPRRGRRPHRRDPPRVVRPGGRRPRAARSATSTWPRSRCRTRSRPRSCDGRATASRTSRARGSSAPPTTARSTCIRRQRVGADRERSAVESGRAGRAARSRRARRRAARPAVRLLPSGAGRGGPRGADAAHRRGPDRRGDRARLPDRARHGRPAAGAREAARARGRDPAPRPSARAAVGAARRRARDGLPALQRGLRRHRRARSDPRRAVRRGDPPRAAAGAADAGRAGGARVCSRCCCAPTRAGRRGTTATGWCRSTSTTARGTTARCCARGRRWWSRRCGASPGRTACRRRSRRCTRRRRRRTRHRLAADRRALRRAARDGRARRWWR